MLIALDIICFAVPFMMLFGTVFSVATGVSGCWWPIYTRDVLMAVALWQFSNNPPNSASVADTMTFLIILHSTHTGPFWGGIDCIGVSDFGPRKNNHQICFVPLVIKCRMNPNKPGESFRLLCICYRVWMYCAVIYKSSYLFCGFDYWLGLYLRQ